eukprot:TRINITY_DN397_c0_g1_i2.p2 TRINITY_DN397_c0_g1~~TRINITY_DN397_c0_g1_i2.p2  ORF type:complete len:112 (+),score=54.15 TRINITY_DN397_c0_g1_i2:137-472(+)
MAMKYCAAYLMAVLSGNDNPSTDDLKKILGAVECEFDEEIAKKLVSELEGKTVHEVIAEGKTKLKSFGGGGGSGGGAAAAGGAAGGDAPAAEKKAVVEEEEEEEMDFDLFG